MKNTFAIVALLIFGIIITSCKDSKKIQYEEIDKRIESELLKGERSDTIFLDFHFGMTEKQVNSHLKGLTKINKLTTNRRGHYQYQFSFENTLPKIANATISTDYFNERLYQLTLSVKSDDLMGTPDLIHGNLSLMYIKKYGSCLEKKSAISETINYVWINRNKMIELIRGIDDVRIIYTDLISQKEKTLLDKKNQSIKTEEVKNDI